MKKKFTFVIAMLLVVALAMPSSAAVFTDVSTDHWAYEAVNKLVAAGIIEGYPDGTFKGDKGVTRYEVAMMVDRVLERVAEERASLEDEVDAMKDGFTSAQKTELEDIVKSIVEKNMPEPKEETSEDTEGLNEKEYEQIANLIEALTFNYKAELKNLGSDLEDLEDLVDTNQEDLEARIEALENEEPTVQFSGSTGVDMRVLETKGATPYINPFNVDNGSWHVKHFGDNTYDATVNGTDYFYEWADVDVSINTKEIKANLNFETNDRYFGDGSGASYWGDEDQEFLEIDNIGGTIEAPTWSADFGKGDTDVSAEYTDYLMYNNNEYPNKADYYPWVNTTALDGVHLTADNGLDLIVGKSTVEETTEVTLETHLDLVGGEVYIDPDTKILYTDNGTTDDDGNAEYRNVETGEVVSTKDVIDYTYDEYTMAGNMPFTIMGQDIDTYFGTIRKNDTTVDLDNTLLAGMEMERDIDPLTITAEGAMSQKGNTNGQMFRLGAKAEMGPVSLEGNYENIEDFDGIRDALHFYDRSGYDFKASSEYGPVSVEGYYENYDNEPMMYGDVQLDTEMAGFEVTGQFKQENRFDSNTGDMEYGQQLRNLTATTDMGMFTLTGEYDYEADVNALEPYDGYGYTHTFPLDDGETIGLDYDANDVIGTLEAQVTENTSAFVELEYALGDTFDENDLSWSDPASGEALTTTIGGETSYGIFGASFEKEFEYVTEVSGNITPDAYTLMGISFAPKLEATYYMFDKNEHWFSEDSAYNLLAKLDGTYEANENLTITGGYEYDRKYYLGALSELEGSYRVNGNDSATDNLHGVLQTTTLGAEYTISDDVSATADYKHVDFAGENQSDDYIVDEAKAGVSVSF